MFTNLEISEQRIKVTGNSFLSLGLTTLLALAMVGCGGNVASNTGANSSASNSVASSNNNGVQGPVNIDPSEVNSSSTSGDAMAADVANAQRSLADRSHITVANPTNPDGSKGTAKPITRPAPDNSEYWSTLTDVAREYREFKGHPQIKKVEKTIDGKTSVVRIFTSNGKSVDVSGDKFPDIARVSVNEFVVAAGLQPIVPKAPPAGPAKENPGKKKSETILPGVPQ